VTLRMTIVFSAVLITTIGYGISFPLLAIRLEAMQVSSGLIGLNAAMPALAWIIITPFLPRLHQKFSSKMLMLSFLGIALIGLLGFVSVENLWLWLFFRFAFGGGLGMLYRVVEYWLNTATQKENRGRIIGVYSVVFLLGIVIGSLLQPELGTEGMSVFAAIGIALMIGGLLIFLAPFGTHTVPDDRASLTFVRSVAIVAPIAMAGVVAYGLIEDVPAYLLSVYSLKAGLGEDIAAYTLTAFALGNLLLAVPLGIVSDKIGRTPVMLICALMGLLGTAVDVIPENVLVFG